jgi:hypothetical protein
MAATIEIDESNGAAETVTHGITSAYYGSADGVHLTLAGAGIVANTNSYEKWWRYHVSALGGASSVKNLRVFASAGPGINDLHQTNAHTIQATYDTAKRTAYLQPGTGTTRTPNTMPTSILPASANLGIAGSLTGSLTVPGSSDYLVSQIRVAAGSTTGATFVMTFGYDEIV